MSSTPGSPSIEGPSRGRTLERFPATPGRREPSPQGNSGARWLLWAGVVILAGMIKTGRVVGVMLLGLLVAVVLPALNVNSTLSVFIAFAVMLVVVSVLAARQEGRRSRGAIARDEARTSGERRQ
jgi:membrane protein implicated in regulation of membrane protease activity